MKLRALLLSACVISITMSASQSHSANLTWDAGAGTTNWLDAVNWSTNTLPTNADTAIINMASGVTVTSPGAIANLTRLGITGGVNTNLSISGGGTLNSLARIGFATGASGEVMVTGAGSLWSSGGVFVLGNGINSTATLDVLSGGSVTSASNTVLANSAGSSGYATISGNGSTLISAAGLYIGIAGTGNMDVLGGADVSNVNGYIGDTGGSSGFATVDGSGSTWANSGDLRVGNAGAGTLTVSNGGQVSVTGTLHIASQGGSSGTLNIGAAGADPAAAAGVISAAAIQFGPGTGTINFKHTNTGYDFGYDLTGGGTMNFLAGTTILSGDNSGFTGTANVSDSILQVNGLFGGTLNVSSSGRLRGSGTLSSLVVNNGSTAAPGNSIGTLNAGAVTFNPGSTYEVEINSAGQSDLIDATGTATINGGDVSVIPFPDVRLNNPYTILSAAGGVTGTFDDVSLSGMLTSLYNPILSYDANNIYLTLFALSGGLEQAAQTFNQKGAAREASALPTGNAVSSALNGLSDDNDIRHALDQLSGEIHASATGALMRAQDDLKNIAREVSGIWRPEGNSPWIKTYRSRAWIDSNANTASLNEDSKGIFVGLVHKQDNLEYGGGVGASRLDVVQDTRRSRANADSANILAFGKLDMPGSGIRVRGGISGSLHHIETKRSIAFAGFAGTSLGDYKAASAQTFIEAEKPFIIAQNAEISPYAQAAYILHYGESFNESGEASLHGDNETNGLGSTTIGLRADKIFKNGAQMFMLTANAGWKRNYGDLDATRIIRFTDAGGHGSAIRGAPTVQDEFLGGAGISIKLNPALSLSAMYQASFAPKGVRQEISGRFSMSF